MRSRSLRILLLGVFSLWFGVIVPGHERGAIRVPGAKAAAAVKSCETTKSHCSHCPTTGKPLPAPGTAPGSAPASPSDPDSDPASHCAICHLTGVLDAPTAIHFTIPQAQLLTCLPPAAYESIAAVAFISTGTVRGPPSLFI